MRVSDMMPRRSATCEPFEGLLDAAARMERERQSCITVVAADGSRRVVGLLSQSDVSNAVARDPDSLHELCVRAAMGGVPATCRPAETLDDALDRMVEEGTLNLPVLDDCGRLLGLLSLRDVARALLHDGADHTAACRMVCQMLAAD